MYHLVMNSPFTADLETALRDLGRFSPPLAKALANRDELGGELFPEGGLDQPVDRAALDRLFGPLEDLLGLDEADFFSRLRRIKEAAFVHMALRDLWRLADLEEVMAGLSGLAELALDRALTYGLTQLRAKRRLDPWPPDAPLPVCILGMGKLGARELNYSSDIDIIPVYDPALWPDEARYSAAEAAAYLATFIGRALGRPTGDGLVFRVDLDLRPTGKDGPPAVSLEMARHHYLYRAAEWERLALIKMRPVAGNLNLGQGLIDDTRPFVFRRHLDYTALDELKDLKAKIARRPRSLTRQGYDVKLDRGGIRQLEFFVQTLQLIFAGRNPGLRRPATLDALADLAQAEIITRRDSHDLSRAYRFLRRTEHRIHLHRLGQEQSLPADRDGLDRLGRALGYGEPTPGRDFDDDLAVVTGVVARHFESLLSGGDQAHDSRPLARVLEALEDGDDDYCLDLLAMAGFLEPKRALASITNLTSDGFLAHSMGRQRKLLRQVLPATLDRVLRAAEPDAALSRLEGFFSRIGPKTGLFMLLLENPKVIDLLVTLMASSAYLSRVLSTHPGLLDSLIDRRTDSDKNLADLAEELDHLLTAAADEEARLDVIRRFKAEETLRIAVNDLVDGLPLERVSDQLSDLAEVVLTRSLDLAADMLSRRYDGADFSIPQFAILALGKLGGRELAYHSDLDVIFIHRPQGDQAQRQEAGVYAARLAQRVISLLSAPMAEGPGYELDARLRPSGRQGPLVVTLESFIDYHRSSQIWEKLALTKARLVAGDSELGADALAAIRRAVFETEPEPGWVDRLIELRQRMGDERGAKKDFDLKFGPGGLIEVEFAFEALLIKHGGREPELITPHALKGLTALYRAGHLAEADYQALYSGYRLVRRLDHRLRILYDRSGDRVGYGQAEIIRAGGDPDQLASAMAEVTRSYRRVMEAL